MDNNGSKLRAKRHTILPLLESQQSHLFSSTNQHASDRRHSPERCSVMVGCALLIAWNVGELGWLADFILTGFEGGELLVI